MKVQSPRWRHRLAFEVMLALAICPKVLLCQVEKLLPHQDTQVWATFDAYHPLGENTNLLLSAQLRYSNDLGHLTYRRINTGFAFRWHKFLTLEPHYQYTVGDSLSGRITHENRLAFAATVGVPWKQWNISDRNQVERRFLEYLRTWRYRNRVELRRPILAARKQWIIFVWDEVFYSSLLQRWYRNRFALGAEKKLGRRVSIDVFYLQQNDGHSRPGDLNTLGLTLKTRF